MLWTSPGRKGQGVTAVGIGPKLPVHVVVAAGGDHDPFANLEGLFEALAREVEARKLEEGAVFELEMVVEVHQVRLAEAVERPELSPRNVGSELPKPRCVRHRHLRWSS